MHEFYLGLYACTMCNSMHDTGISMHSTGAFHACTMHGTGIFMHSTGVFHACSMHGTGISMHSTGVIHACSMHGIQKFPCVHHAQFRPIDIQEKSVKLCKLATMLEYKGLCKIVLASTKKCSCVWKCGISATTGVL